MNRENLYLSTIDPNSHMLATQIGLGLEITEYCTAWNMDDKFQDTDEIVCRKIEGVSKLVLHAPFNELFPCAIDPKARELAAHRYRQAIKLAKNYGAAKVIIHGGFNPWIYYPVWYTEQSILFWQAFLKDDPGVEIVLENVLETEAAMLLEIIKGVDSPKLRMCLDVGHINAYSKIPVMKWLETCAPYISHFHIHNNEGSWDTHSALDQGSIPMRELLMCAEELCPNVTYTLELMDAESSVRWLLEEYKWNCRNGSHLFRHWTK